MIGSTGVVRLCARTWAGSVALSSSSVAAIPASRDTYDCEHTWWWIIGHGATSFSCAIAMRFTARWGKATAFRGCHPNATIEKRKFLGIWACNAGWNQREQGLCR